MKVYFERKRAVLGELVYAGLMAGIMAGIIGAVLILLRADGERTWSPFARTALGFFGRSGTAGVYVGVLSGIIAGGAMALLMIVSAAIQGEGLRPIQLIAATVFDERAREEPPRFSIILTGLLIHFATAALFGLLWVSVLRPASSMTALIEGAIYGLIIWGVQQYGILPVINKPLARGMRPGPFAAAHFFFGATLGIASFFFRQALSLNLYLPAVWVGLFSLFVVSETAGVIFALLGGDWTIGKAVGWGAPYGLLLWLILHGMIYTLNPPLGRALATTLFAVWNILVGIVIGLYPAFLEPRPAEAAGEEEWRRAA